MIKEVEITKAILIWVPPQNEQYYRPYEANLNGSNMHRMKDATENGSNLSSVAMAHAASDILSPSITPKEQLVIPGGLGSSRFAFFIECTSKNLYGNRRELITGFTDHDGITATGAIDPNMNLHINNIVEIGEADKVGANGVMQRSLLSSSQVLAERPVTNDIFSMRPEDVVCAGQFSIAAEAGLSNVSIDTRNAINGGVKAKLSTRNNVIPSKYLSTVTNGLVSALAGEGVIGGMEEVGSSVYVDAVNNLRETSVLLGNFYTELGLNDSFSTHTVRFSQISSVWPRPNDFWSKIMPRPGETITSPIETSEHWRGSNIATNIAFSLTHAVPALMSSIMLLKLEVSITNMNLTGQPEVVILNHTPMFSGTVLHMHLVHLVNQIELEIINGILRNKVNLFDIHMNIDLLKNSKIDISVNGEQSIPFVAPLFCDSYYSPVLGLERSSMSELNSAVELMVSELVPKAPGFSMEVSNIPITPSVPAPPNSLNILTPTIADNIPVAPRRNF